MVFGGIVALAGMAGIYASAKIYLVPARPAWNTIRTPLRFFLTGFILGPLFSLVVYSFYVLANHPGAAFQEIRGPVLAWLAISSGAALAQLLVLFARLFYLDEEKNPELYDSALLLTRRFKVHFLARIGLLLLGSFILPLFYLIYFLTSPQFSGTQTVVFSVVSFAISILGEFLGRYLFFATVVPKNMPGSFFAKNGSHV